jgi:hypothetical protein
VIPLLLQAIDWALRPRGTPPVAERQPQALPADRPEPASDQYKRAWDEYALLQNKLDRIGDFRFKVRGWTIALVSALFLASSVTAAKIAWYSYAFALFVLCMFHLMERLQGEWSEAFRTRLMWLEGYLNQAGETQVPGVVSAVTDTRRRLRRRWFGRILLSHETWFYAVSYVVVLVALGSAVPWGKLVQYGSYGMDKVRNIVHIIYPR